MDYKKVFRVFKKNYEPVPLEVFGCNPYTTLISTLLSSRTKDELTLRVSKSLFKVAPNLRSLSKMTEQEISKIIYPVGFYKTKAKHLKKLANIIINDFDGIIPNNREDLMKLPGVGRKTANLVLNRAFKNPAIAVDTHVHRISNLLGWVNTKTPEQTEKKLTELLPKKYWSDLNRFFVSIGRQYRSRRLLEDFLKENKLI